MSRGAGRYGPDELLWGDDRRRFEGAGGSSFPASHGAGSFAITARFVVVGILKFVMRTSA